MQTLLCHTPYLESRLTGQVSSYRLDFSQSPTEELSFKILYLCKPQAFPPVYLNSSPLEARFYHQGLKIDLWANANSSVLISMESTFFLVSDFFFFFLSYLYYQFYQSPNPQKILYIMHFQVIPTTGIVKFKYNKVYKRCFIIFNSYILANNNYTAISHTVVSQKTSDLGEEI